MKKRLSSRLALVSALTMLAVEALSPAAVIAAEDEAVQTEYAETAIQEAEVEEAQSEDSESVAVSGVEEETEDLENAEVNSTEDEAEDSPEEDVLGKTYKGELDLGYPHSVKVVDCEPGEEENVLNIRSDVVEKDGRQETYYEYNILEDGEYYIYSLANWSCMSTYVNVAENVNATLTFGRVEANNEGLNNLLGEGNEKALINAAPGSVITLNYKEPIPGSYSNTVVMTGGGFIDQKGSKSVINVNMKNGDEDGDFFVSNADNANNLFDLITTEGTMNMNSGTLGLMHCPSAISLKGGTLNVINGTLGISDCCRNKPAIMAKGGTVNVKGGKLDIEAPETEGSGDDCIRVEKDGDKTGLVKIAGGEVTLESQANGINAEKVEITGGKTVIYTNVEGLNESEPTYTEGSDDQVYNTINKKDKVTTERVNLALGSHKGIKVGEMARTIKFEDGSADKTVPASGSLTIKGGTVFINTLNNGLKFDKAGDKVTAKATDSGVYIYGAPDDAISCGKDVQIEGGRLELFSSNTGIAAGGNVTIKGTADVQIPNCYEGIEGKQIVIGEEKSTLSTNVVIGKLEGKILGELFREQKSYCLGEGICASSKTVVYNYKNADALARSPLTGYTKVSTSTGGNTLRVNSGNVRIYVDSENAHSYVPFDPTFYSTGDGIHCDGAYEHVGGLVKVYGESDNDDTVPFSTDKSFLFEDGSTMLGTGRDYNGVSEPTDGTGVYIIWGGKGAAHLPAALKTKSMKNFEEPALGADDFSFKAGDEFKVKDAEGTLIYNEKLPFSGTFIIFGSPKLKADEDYTVTVGDSKPQVLKGKRQREPEPEEEEPEDPEKKDDPVSVPSDMETANVLGYTVSWNKTVSFNGAKIETTNSSLKVVFAGAEVGQSISNNTILFSKIKYKNNKNAAGVSANKAPQMVLQFKLNKLNPQDKEYAKMSKQEFKAFKKAKKEEVKALNKYFKSNPIKFTIAPRIISVSEIPVEYNKSTYKTKNKKLKLNFKVDTKASKPNGKGTVKPFKVKAEKKGKGDFKVVKFDEKTGFATIEGINNFTGTTQVKVTIK